MYSEIEVMAIMDQFKVEHLNKGEELLGFAILDEEDLTITASTFNPNHHHTKEPIKNWIIYNRGLGIKAFRMRTPNDFRKFEGTKISGEA